MKSRYLQTIFLAFLLASSWIGSCPGQEILIVGNHDKAPKVFLKDGRPSGILVDILNHLERELPYSFRYQLYPWKRAYKEAVRGEGAVIGLSKNSERLKIFDYSEVMFYDEVVCVVRKGNEFTFNSIQDLRGKLVGVQRGASYGDDFEAAKGRLFFLDEDDSGLRRLLKLLTGRIDVALLSPGRAGVMAVIHQDPDLLARQDEFVILDKPFKRDPNYLGFAKSRQMQHFIRKFNAALKGAHQSGAIQRIVDRYVLLSPTAAVETDQ